MAKVRKFPEKVRLEALRLLDGGMKRGEVSEKLGVSRPVISRWATQEDKDEMKVVRKHGQNIQELRSEIHQLRQTIDLIRAVLK